MFCFICLPIILIILSGIGESMGVRVFGKKDWVFRSSERVVQNLEIKISFNLPFLSNESKKTIIKGKNTCNNIQKSNENWFDQVAVLNYQKNSKWFWKASEIYQLRFINAE